MDWYRRTLVFLLLIMLAGFSIVSVTTLQKCGFEYIDTILVKSEANGSVIFSDNKSEANELIRFFGNGVFLSEAVFEKIHIERVE